MRVSFVSIFLLALAFACASASGAGGRASFLRGVNGGSNCVACTVIVNIVEQLTIINNSTVEAALVKFCNFFPVGLFRSTCRTAIDMFGPVIIDGLYTKQTPDVVCQSLKFCTIDAGQPECHIFPKPKNGLYGATEAFNAQLQSKSIDKPTKSFCDYPVFKPICDFFDRAFNNRKPSEDVDLDGFSDYGPLRGSSWRGKDCNDLNAKVHPGVKSDGDRAADSNCNGIFGVDKNGTSYEDKFCKGSDQRGIISLGDSVTAHFHLPPEWFDGTTISPAAFEHVAFIIENEIDWPHLSGTTGHFQNDWPVVVGNTSSLYLKLWQRNKCNFRDYQNIGVNGADTVGMNKIVTTVSRDQTLDEPAIVVYSLVGNDVCNGHPDTFAHMTKPDEFYKSVITTMQYLDTILPNGSHVLLTGLANGSYLYGLLSERVHPIGNLKKDVLYKDFYTYLSCLQISPCNGWMTVNDSVRANTTAYAAYLSTLVQNVTVTHKFKNFDMAYTDFPLQIMVEKWSAMGREPWEVIEVIDGFHTNQNGHFLYAESIWEILTQSYPDWIGPVNPNNDQITMMFGDQGGY